MAIHGVLVLDKPTGMSSAAAVDHVKRMLGASRAGHGGTLDPIATGVLAICLGSATKIAQYLLADDKAYEATGVLGVETDTLDRDGRIVRERPVAVTEEAMREAIARRRGEQDQVPPMYSAIKQGGVRNYHRARAGEEIERAARRIRIDQLELRRFAPPRFELAIACSKGTYVRSVLADLGDELGCGAYLTELRRTRSGRFTIEQAFRLEQVATIDPTRDLVPITEATSLPRKVVPPALLKQVISGLQLPYATWEAVAGTSEPAASAESGPLDQAPRSQLLDEHGRLVAIIHEVEGRTVYDRVFPELVTA